MPERDTNAAFAFQEKILADLSLLPYQELDELKGRINIESPQELTEFDFAREINDDELGGLEVSVFHYWFPDESELQKINEICGVNDEITIGECSMRRWFNIQPNGNIEWPSFEHQEGED